jgi:transposase
VSSLYAIEGAVATNHAVVCDCLAHRYGNAGDRRVRQRTYPTDLTDAQWAAVVPLVPVPAWMGGRGGRPEGYCHREMIDAVLYLVDNGTKWRALPIDFPAWDAVYRFFRRWRDQGLLTVLHDRLRRACRVDDGRAPEPTAGCVDSQSLRAAETVGAARRGYDGGKKINGTKRHIAVDTIGLLLTVLVTGAGVQDRDGAMPLLERLRAACLRIRHVWADGGYAGQLVDWCAGHLGLRLQIVKRSDRHRFVVLPRRWVVERTLAWITRRRRCVRDYERRADTHEAMVYWAMTLVMTRRLARSRPAVTQRGTDLAPARPASRDRQAA